jgi:hypothetical protein
MYAIYLNDIERFIVLEKDLWIAMSASKLLSSKLSICVCDIGNTDLTNDNCFQWTLSTPELPESGQYPRLVLPANAKLEFVGDPISTNMYTFRSHQRFCLLVLKILTAAKMTDAVLNTADRKYFMSLLEFNEVGATSDDSGIPDGFLHSIEKILYLETSEQGVLNQIDAMFNNSASIFPRILTQYKLVFNKYLNV